MKRSKEIMVLAGLALLLLPATYAQNSTLPSGGDAIGDGGTSSYSVGQINYTSNSGKNGLVLQGIQVPYEISSGTSIKDAKNIDLHYVAYPNPVSDMLQLSIKAKSDLVSKNLIYQILDISGKLMHSGKINGSSSQIDMSKLGPAIYFMRIVSGDQTLKTFKIIKTQKQ